MLIALLNYIANFFKYVVCDIYDRFEAWVISALLDFNSLDGVLGLRMREIRRIVLWLIGNCFVSLSLSLFEVLFQYVRLSPHWFIAFGSISALWNFTVSARILIPQIESNTRYPDSLSFSRHSSNFNKSSLIQHVQNTSSTFFTKI